MTFDIITLFPDMFAGPFDLSIIKRAKEKKIVDINLLNLCKFAIDKRGTVDDRPYGGGVGMVMRIEPIDKALHEVFNEKSKIKNKKSRVILLDPRGKKFTQSIARELAKLDHIVLVCGHYEGVDERVREHLVDESLSIGNYVLTGGEIPAMVVVDSVTRLLPGVLEKPEATEIESFSKQTADGSQQLEYPQYTRPEEFNGWKVPEVLLSGNHQEIEKWRKNES